MHSVWTRYPVVRLTIPFVAGMVTANFLLPLHLLSPLWLAGLLGVAAVVLFMSVLLQNRSAHQHVFGIAAVCFCFLFGLFLFVHHQPLTGDVPVSRRTKTETPIQRVIHERYEAAGIDGTSGVVIEAMTTGNKSRLSSGLRKDYSNAGVAHILALSGFHLTILLALFDLFLLRSYLPRRWRRGCGLLVIPLLWLYAWMAGMPVSLVRAATMCSFLQLALMLSAQYDILNACSVAALLMLLVDPRLILDIGFQLSFASIIGIVTMGLPLFRFWQQHGHLASWAWLRHPQQWVMGTLIISASCTLFTFPLSAYHFGQIPLFSLFSNIVVSLLAIVIMWGACFWWLCFWCDALQRTIAFVLTLSAGLMNDMTTWIAALPFAVAPYRPAVMEVVALYATLLCFVGFGHRQTARRLIAALSSLFVFLLLRLF